MSSIENEKVLERVARILRDRQAAYGSNHEVINGAAELWSDYLQQMYPDANVGFSAHDAYMMMVLFKVARVSVSKGADNRATLDSLLDIAGYAILAATLVPSYGEEATTNEPR